MKRPTFISIGILVLLLNTFNASAAVLYGTAKPGDHQAGHIFKIDTIAHKIEILVDISTTPVIPSGAPEIVLGRGDSPNANAFDAKNNRFFFASFEDPGTPADSSVSSSELYFVVLDDPNVIVWAGSLNWHASDATFYKGKYWYIGHGTNILREVSLKRDGTINNDDEVTVIWLSDPNSGELYSPLWSFGDIAFNSKGLLYLTGSISNELDQPERSLSGTVEIETGQFTEIGISVYWGQIAFGPDRTLYGHDSDTGDFFTINIADGATTYIFTYDMFTDLAAPTSDRGFLRGAFKPGR